MKCEGAGSSEIAERYVLGQLNEAEAIAYEAHFFECPRCFADLQTVQALREELRRRDHVALLGKPRSQWWTWFAVAAAVVMAVAIGWRMTRRIPGGTIANTPADHSAPLPKTPTLSSRRVAKLELLSRVEPPPYHAPNLRESARPAEVRFREAMKLYRKKDYVTALPALEAAATLDSRAAGAPFFAGICQLLQNLPDAAIANFERVLSLGESPYLEMAHFYRAKALLRKADVAGAARALDTVVGLKGDLEDEARRLDEQVRELQRDAP